MPHIVFIGFEYLHGNQEYVYSLWQLIDLQDDGNESEIPCSLISSQIIYSFYCQLTVCKGSNTDKNYEMHINMLAYQKVNVDSLRHRDK